MNRFSILVPILVVLSVLTAQAQARQKSSGPNQPLLWLVDAQPREQDVYAGFRGVFNLAGPTDIEIRLVGASWYGAWLDDKWLTDGPPRFPLTHPEYQRFQLRLGAGRHVVAVQVHAVGVSTRMLEAIEPFLYCEVIANGMPVTAEWKCARLPGYARQVRRINPQLGWIEWCDTRGLPEWRGPAFDDSTWRRPAAVERPIGSLRPLPTANTRSIRRTLKPAASGTLVDGFGYELDDIPARFFLRNLSPGSTPPQGVWRRYDLGRVRLARPRFTIDAPRDSVVEFAYAESLQHGRVPPWITLSAGPSCSLDHYVARGGPQEYSPLTPKGGRFLEVHVVAPPGKTTVPIRFTREEVVERAYYGAPEGSFTSDDPLLNQIWTVGVETHRACAEDSLVDNPTRERGQWAGDVVSVGMEVAGSAYSDLRLCRRGLVQCAQSAREDGLVSGLCPGGGAYLSTYAAQWVSACVEYWRKTGDRALLADLYPAAERNIAAFEKQRGKEGVANALAWGFVDWGYTPSPGPCDVAVTLHYLAAMRDMILWSNAVGKPDRATAYRLIARGVEHTVRLYFDSELHAGFDPWPRIGYHRAVLGLRLGLFTGTRERECVRFIKRHILSCFPNNTGAPRLSDPAANNPQLITPYFAHFAMPLLAERGEMDFVLNQYRKCWGWALQDGRTTWLEVFDTRWSHCHQWSGCPTWQLTRYSLGLRPRFDLGDRHFDLTLRPGSLKRAAGTIPVPGGRPIQVAWRRTAGAIRYTIESADSVTLHHPSGNTTRVNGKREILLGVR